MREYQQNFELCYLSSHRFASLGSVNTSRSRSEKHKPRFLPLRPVQSMATSSVAKAKTALDEMSKTGEFKRTEAGFRNFISEEGKFKPEAGRYHLYISYACPWANRCLAALNVKGLQDVIGLSVVHPTWQRSRPDDSDDQHTGWVFAAPGDAPLTSTSGYGSFPTDDCIPDSVNGAKFVRDLYEKANDTTGKYSVPVLWDKVEGTIVNNESSEIMCMFNASFNKLAKNPELDLYPAGMAAEIEAVNEWVYPTINNGVYRCGFATSQQAYETAFGELFASLDRAEEILSKQRYIAGSAFTEADIRLFMTLIRFDEVYVVYFKTNRNFIYEFPNLSNYVREVYQYPGMRECVNMAHIKTHYFTSHPKLNFYSIIPKGGAAWWEDAHNRASLGSKM